MRAVDSIVWPGDGTTYVYSDTNPQAEVGAFSSHDGRIMASSSTRTQEHSHADRGVGTHRAHLSPTAGCLFTPSTRRLETHRAVLEPPPRIRHWAHLNDSSPACAAPPNCNWAVGAPVWQRCSGGIFDDSQVFAHNGSYHMFHSRKRSNDTLGCTSDAVRGRNDWVEGMVSKDAMHWEPRGVVLAARGDPKVGNRSCTGKLLACIQGGFEPMAATTTTKSLCLLPTARTLRHSWHPLRAWRRQTRRGRSLSRQARFTCPLRIWGHP